MASVCFRKKTALLAATILAGGALCSAGSAFAQGTDADRIAALEAQVQMLMRELQSIKAEQAARPAPAASAAPRGAATPVTVAQGTAAPLAPQTVQTPPSPGVAGNPFYTALPEGRTTGVLATGNDKVSLAFSGQINRALNVIDDGRKTRLYQVDNENASSRFRFLGSSAPYNDTIALTAFEFEWPYNGTLDVSQLDQSVSSQINQDFNLRLLEIGFSNASLGSVFIGQGWMASDGTAEIDISGITTPFWVGQTFAFGGMLPTAGGGFVLKEGPQAAFDEDPASVDLNNPANFVNVFGLGNDLDGLSRLVRVRYNTPIYAGFQLSAAAATENRYDVALRYAGQTDWARFAAAASYWTDTSDNGYDGYTGSASMILTDDSAWWDGLSFTLSAGTQDFDNRKNSPTTYFGKVGYTTTIWDMGRTGFAFGYGNYDEFRVKNEEMELFGVGFSQNVDKLGTELYGGLWKTQFSNPDINYNDMTTFQLGAMVRF